MRVNPNNIAPSQDFLKPRTVAFILECIQHDKESELPPTPIVRQDDEGNYVAIDGHNLLAAKSFRGEELEVHVAHNKHDGLPATTPANKQRNADLEEKFDTCLVDRARVATAGYATIEDLVRAHAALFTEET